MPTAVYPGSLDPITFGHTTAIADATEAFGKLVVAIGINPAKNYTFSLAEREELARKATAHIPGVTVTSFSGLLVNYLVRHDLNIVVRGLRNGQDFNDALLQDTLGWQQNLAKGIKALYVPARTGQQFISSTALKVVLKDQGNALDLAPLSTIQATQARMLGQYLYGATGPSGVGKSFICQKFKELAAARGIPLTHIDLDRIGHEILDSAEEPIYQKARADVIMAFGPTVAAEDGTINRKALGQIVFGDSEKLSQLNAILHDPIFFSLNDRIRGKAGIFLIDAALLAESARAPLVNNNVLVVDAPDHERAKRLSVRDGLTDEQIARRIGSQYSVDVKAEIVRNAIAQANHGALDSFQNDDRTTDDDYAAAFERMLSRIDIYGELRICGFLKSLGVEKPAAAYQALRAMYSGNERFYHGLAHIVDGLNKMAGFVDRLDSAAAFTLAWLFHDAVYDNSRDDNEVESAAVMEVMCAGWGIEKALVGEAKGLILATQHGVVEPETQDQTWMVDLDMSVLGSSPEAYDLYENGVRREYGNMTEIAWNQARKKFLAGLMENPLFRTDYFRENYEKLAVANVNRALAR